MVIGYFLLLSDKLKFYKLKASRKSLVLSLRNTGYMIKVGMATFIAELSMGIMMVAGNYMFLSYLGVRGWRHSVWDVIFSPNILDKQCRCTGFSAHHKLQLRGGSFDRVREALKIAPSRRLRVEC